MSSSRFSFFDSPSPDDALLRHADALEIKLIRVREGRLGFTFKLSGGYLHGWSDDDDDDSDSDLKEQVDVERLADDLLRRFADASRKGGGK